MQGEKWEDRNEFVPRDKFALRRKTADNTSWSGAMRWEESANAWDLESAAFMRKVLERAAGFWVNEQRVSSQFEEVRHRHDMQRIVDASGKMLVWSRT